MGPRDDITLRSYSKARLPRLFANSTSTDAEILEASRISQAGIAAATNTGASVSQPVHQPLPQQDEHANDQMLEDIWNSAYAQGSSDAQEDAQANGFTDGWVQGTAFAVALLRQWSDLGPHAIDEFKDRLTDALPEHLAAVQSDGKEGSNERENGNGDA